ncbi:hypothetical protein Bca101_087984 [Brassica carinata]
MLRPNNLRSKPVKERNPRGKGVILKMLRTLSVLNLHCVYQQKISILRMFSLDHYEWRMPRMHYGRRNTREYAQRRHYDMEGNLVLPMFPDPEEQYREFPFSLQPKRAPRKHGRPCKPPSAAGDPKGVHRKCRCGVLIKNAQEDRSVAGYTEDFINQAKLCKPKNAETWCIWYKSGLRKELQAPLRGVWSPQFALVRRMAGFAMEAKRRLQPMWRSLEHGRRNRVGASMAMRCGRELAKESGASRKPPTMTCDCDVWSDGSEATQDIREELVGVLEPLEFALVRRMATKHCTRRSGWRKVRRRPSMIASQRAMKTLDPRPAAPRHVNVARRYPRDESCAEFSLTNYCRPTPFIYDIHSLVLKIPVELSRFVCLP